MTLRISIAIVATLCAVSLSAQDPKQLLADGKKEWFRYETLANQAPGCDSISPSLDSARTRTVGLVKITVSIEAGLKRIHNQLVDCRAPFGKGGDDTFERAERLFRQAYAAAPADASIFRHLAMLFAEKSRWRDLEAVSRDHAAKAPGDPWGWLAWGLAVHRNNGPNAAALFDTASARMNREDRARVFAFTRLLARPDSIAYMKGREDARAETERRFWAIADPLWSREGNDPRTEFMARVAYSELRWTIDEPLVRGADSNRGEIHIRYGPPQRIVAMRGDDFNGNEMRDGQAPRASSDRSMMPPRSDIVTYWDYDNGVTIVFWGTPTYGTARFPIVDGGNVEEVFEKQASSFDNIVPERILDIPSVAMRFRGPADSVDVLIIAQAPVAEMRSAIGVNARLHMDTWFLGLNVPTAFRDTTTVRSSGVERSSRRVAPATYQYRIEVTAEGATLAARTFATVNASNLGETGFATRGFGASDIVIASSVQAPRVPTQPVRWSDFSAAPIVGVMQKAATFEMLWENYDISARNGQAQYHVAVTVQREHSGPGKVAAALLGFAANVLRIDRKDDRVISQFDRAAPAAPVIVDHVSVGLADTPPGEYRVTLEVTDTATNRKTTRVTTVIIRD